MSGRRLLTPALLALAALMWTAPALADPANTSPPQLSGGTLDGNGAVAFDSSPTLSLSAGTWSSSDSVTLQYQWQSCSYPNAVLADAPLAYFRLGEPAGSTTAVDVSGFAQPGTSGTSLQQAGVPGAIAGDTDSAYAFPLPTFIPGVLYQRSGGDWFTPSDFASGTSPASIEAWIDPAGTAHADGFVAGFGSDQGDDASLNLEVYNTGSGMRLAAFDGVRRYVASSGSIVAGRWYHAVLTYDGRAIRLYQDGALVGTFAEASTFSLVPEVARLDASVPMSTVVQRFGGSVDDVAFYGTALTASTVAAHRAAGANADSAVRCNDIPGATDPTFTVPSSLSGTRIRGQVEAADSTGATAAWSTELPLSGAVLVAQPQDLTSVIPYGPTLVSGTVVDAAGAPVAGARVSVYLDLPTWTRVTAPLLGEAYTADDGSYRITYDDTSTPLLNLVVVARGRGVGATTYLAREYDDAAGAWLDDSGALAGPLDVVLPATPTATLLDGPSRNFPVPCPPPRKTLIAGPKVGIMSVADVHTWSYVKARLSYVHGSNTTANIAVSASPASGFVASGATATFSGGNSLSQQYPMRGPGTNIAETTAADAAEFKTVKNCWQTIYTVEPTSFIGGTTTPRSVSSGSNGRCPTQITDNSTFYVPTATVTRSTGRGVTYAGGFSISFGVFSIGLTVRTDWSTTTTETWYPQTGGGAKVWFCGDGTARKWFNAQRIYDGPWTS